MRIAVVGLVVSFLLSTNAHALVPRVTLESCDMAEICGDGVDQDCDGTDRECPGADADRDGFAAAEDCDDADRFVYDGVSQACTAACGRGVRTCLPAGAWSACTCGPLCEATGGGRCYYVSAERGFDDGDGSFESPFRDYRKIVSYYKPSERPHGWVQLEAGDVVYFLDGSYSFTYEYGDPGQEQVRALFLRGVAGTAAHPITLKAYPGHSPILEPDRPTYALYLAQGANIAVEGFEIRFAYDSGLRLAEMAGVEAANLWVHDIDGRQGNNIAGVYITRSVDVVLHHSLLHDNYDRSQKTSNNRNVVVFDGGNIRLTRNVMFQTPEIDAERTGACAVYKHGAAVAGSRFEVDHNVLFRCAYDAVGSGTFNSHIHHNLVVDSAPISLDDFGGRTYSHSNVIEFNTFVGGSGLRYDPSNGYGVGIGSMIYRHNVVFDDSGRGFGRERGLVTVYPYGRDEIYLETVAAGTMTFEGNCYWTTTGEPTWSVFAGHDDLGGVYSFLQWQAQGYDATSHLTDPLLDGDYVAGAAECRGAGWLAAGSAAEPPPPPPPPPAEQCRAEDTVGVLLRETRSGAGRIAFRFPSADLLTGAGDLRVELVISDADGELLRVDANGDWRESRRGRRTDACAR